MPISTQIRLQQVTGSVPVLSSVTQGAQDPGAADVQDLLKAYAQSLANIHGSTDFFARAPGVIDHAAANILIKTQNSAGGELKLDANAATENEAIKIEARDSSGGIKLDAGYQITGSAGLVNFATTTGMLTMRSVDGMELLASGSGHDALLLQSNDGVLVVATGDGAFESSAVLGLTGSSAVNMLGSYLDVKAANGGQLTTDNGGFALKAAGSGGLFMSGALGLTFATDSTGHGGSGGALDLAGPVDGADFVTKFGTKSILAAIVENKNSITAGEPTVFKQRLTGSLPAGFPLSMVSANDPVAEGDVSSFPAAAEENKLEVYVNGQLLMSSSNGRTEDYTVSAQSTLSFEFDLVQDDAVVVYDRS